MNATHRRVDYYCLVRPHFGQRLAGDAAAVIEHEGVMLAAIVDSLGHGPEAHAVAARAMKYLDGAPVAGGPVEMLEGLSSALKGTRGAAAAVGVLDTATGVMRCAAVGNIVIRRFGSGPDRLVSGEGIVGGTMRSPREQRVTLSAGDTIVMYTDGVRDRFEVRDYPQLSLQDAETIARTVIRRFGKDHDDAACVVLRYDP